MEEYDDGYIEFEDCKATADTQMAVLVRCPEFKMPFWVPKSMIHEDSEVWKAFTEGKLIVSRWWCERRGLI